MDYRKLGAAIIFIGIIIAGVGGVRYMQNQPLPLPEIRSATDMLRRGAEHSLVQLENTLRAGRQREALKVVGAGGFIVVIGCVILFAAKPPDDNEKDEPDERYTFDAEAKRRIGS